VGNFTEWETTNKDNSALVKKYGKNNILIIVIVIVVVVVVVVCVVVVCVFVVNIIIFSQRISNVIMMRIIKIQ
jgi:flagellar basal body-associated protein FliL